MGSQIDFRCQFSSVLLTKSVNYKIIKVMLFKFIELTGFDGTLYPISANFRINFRFHHSSLVRVTFFLSIA